MGCHCFKCGSGHGILTLANIYQFGGFTFEWHSYLGPMKLRKKDFEPAKNTGRTFYKMIDKWGKLSKNEQRKYQVYG
jgi:hypothetical protein